MKNIILKVLRESLEEYYITNPSSQNKDSLYKFLYQMFPNIPSETLEEELFTIDFNTSLIAISKNKIIGCLLFSEDSLCSYINNTTLIKKDELPTLDRLCSENGIKGVVFAIDPSFRGSSLNIDFIRKAKQIVSEYDYAYGLVYSFLKTHNYWKRMGMSNYATVLDDGNIVEVYLLDFKKHLVPKL